MLTFSFATLGIETNILLLVGMGFIAGSLSGFLGIGGGILIVPFLNILGASMPNAVATSISYIAGTSLSAALRSKKLGNLEIKAALLTAAGMLPAVEAGARIIEALSALGPETVDSAVRIGYLVLLVIVVGMLILRRKEGANPLAIPIPPHFTLSNGNRISIWLPVLLGIFAGLVSGILGIGGGALIVPIFIAMAGMRTAAAVGSSLLIMLIATSFGAITYGIKGLADYPAAGVMLAGSIAGAFLGASAHAYLPGIFARSSLAVLMLAAGASVILKQFGLGSAAFITLVGVSSAIVVSAAAAGVYNYRKQSKEKNVEGE
jgi:hypothetical protein